MYRLTHWLEDYPRVVERCSIHLICISHRLMALYFTVLLREHKITTKGALCLMDELESEQELLKILHTLRQLYKARMTLFPITIYTPVERYVTLLNERSPILGCDDSEVWQSILKGLSYFPNATFILDGVYHEEVSDCSSKVQPEKQLSLFDNS